MTQKIQLAPAPPRLTDSMGNPVPFGRYAGAIADTSTASWDGGNGPLSPRRLSRKGWLYLGGFTEQYMIGLATVDAGILATAFVYVYDRARKQLVEEKITAPFGFAAPHMPRLKGDWAIAGGGKSWRILPQETGWKAEFTGKRLKLTLELDDTGVPGMSVVAPSVRRPFHYTFKVCAVKARLSVSIDGQAGRAEGSGVVDFSLGYPPRHTFWNWASLGGKTADGRVFGLNTVAQFNNGLENVMWLGNEMFPLAQSTFNYDQKAIEKPWRLTTEDGAVDLRFTPEGKRAERISVGFMLSDFAQPFGRFEGTVTDAAGRPVAVSGWGVVEDHLAVW